MSSLEFLRSCLVVTVVCAGFIHSLSKAQPNLIEFADGNRTSLRNGTSSSRFDGSWKSVHAEPECTRVNGSEEGYWNGTEYHIKGCRLRRVSAAQARSCFRDKTMVWVGDSIHRFQYLSLINLLQFGHYPRPMPTAGRGRRGRGRVMRNILELNAKWGTWFAEVNDHFNDSIWCDCYRVSAWQGEGAKNQMVENRYWSLPSHNISVNLLASFGAWPMHGHFPPPCMGSAGNEPWQSHKFGFKNNQSNQSAGSARGSQCAKSLSGNFNRKTVMAARHKFTASEFHGFSSIGFDWNGTTPHVLRNVIPLLSPDLLLMNFGAWNQLHPETKKPSFAREFLQASHDALCSKGVKCIWKTTTYSRHGSPAGAVSAPSEIHSKFFAKQFNIEIFDAEKITLKTYDYLDNLHFRAHVYNELNNVLLNMLCPRDA
jgi:hypothetical protein